MAVGLFPEWDQMSFLASAWIAKAKAIVVIPKINSCQNHLREKTSKSAKYHRPLRLKKKKKKKKIRRNNNAFGLGQ